MTNYFLAKVIGHLPWEFKGRQRIVSYLYPAGSQPPITKVAPLAGTNRYIHARSTNHIGWNVLVYGGYERNLVRTMKRLLRSGRRQVALDVGANIGVYSLILSELFGRVYSFEPIPEFRKELSANVRLNGIMNVEVIPLALGKRSQSAEMALMIHHDEPQTASVHVGDYSFKDSFEWDFRRTEVLSLDQFAENRSLRSVDYLKIDTDGSEEDVLLGAVQTLLRFQPIIQIELVEEAKKWRRDISPAAIADFLRKHGYTLLDSEGRKHHSSVVNGNYFAVPSQ